MKLCRLLVCAFALALMPYIARAQTPNDPEEIFRKACERVNNANTYRFSGKLFVGAEIDYAAAFKQKVPRKAKTALRKMQKELGKSFQINGEISGMQSEGKSRFEVTDLILLGTGIRKKPERFNDHVIFVYNGEKLYKTQVGSSMDVDAKAEDGFTLLPSPNDTAGFTYRLYPPVKINGTEGYPIEVLGWGDDKKTHRVYTIAPKTYRLLRLELKAETTKIQMTVTKEELNVLLKPNTFTPVLPGKIAATDNNTLVKTGVPFHIDFFSRTAAKN